LEYILYCDESSDKGPNFGDFFGGCLISSTDLVNVVTSLEDKKRDLNLHGEIKWTKVTDNYLEKYKEVMSLFFQYVASGKIKVRIMFRPTTDCPPSNAEHDPDYKYFKLYYQFIKHAFGLMSINAAQEPVFIRIYLDQLPDKREKCLDFKNYLQHMPDTKDFSYSTIKIREGDIAEVCSHDHVLLQCIDVILGAMYFRLNDFHKAIPKGETRRGKRTIAKENLYKHINHLICNIIPSFNIGVSTGDHGYCNPHWNCPYQHWRFTSKK
jgi:hypothetical protein